MQPFFEHVYTLDQKAPLVATHLTDDSALLSLSKTEHLLVYPEKEVPLFKAYLDDRLMELQGTGERKTKEWWARGLPALMFLAVRQVVDPSLQLSHASVKLLSDGRPVTLHAWTGKGTVESQAALTAAVQAAVDRIHEKGSTNPAMDYDTMRGHLGK